MIALFLSLVLQGAIADVPSSEDPNTAVFVPDACGQSEGAPPAASLSTLVLLTDLAEDDPYHAVVTRLAAAKKPRATVAYPTGRPGEARAELAKWLPEFVLIVTRPERIDVNFHFELLEMAAALDPDPFVDFTFGYVTGATPAEALAFAERFLAVAGKKGALPKTLIDFGPVAQGPPSFGGPRAHKLAKGWKETYAYHGPVKDMLARKNLLAGLGVVHAGGHGTPQGIDDGLKASDLRREKIDMAPALYFSGPCYCGVTSAWFDLSQGGCRRMQVAPEESFALAAIASGVTALFAGLDPDRGETCSQELEHLFIHGDALGHAAKETYDGAAIALRRPAFKLFRYQDGGARPQQGLKDTMIGGGASRALFGDPTLVPIAAAAGEPFAVKQKDTEKSLELSWSAAQGPKDFWMCVDVYRCDGSWTHRIAFREEIPLETARALKSFRVAELAAKDGPLQGLYPTAMVERYGGKAFLHVYLVFPPAGQQNVFYVKRDFRARFVFEK